MVENILLKVFENLNPGVSGLPFDEFVDGLRLSDRGRLLLNGLDQLVAFSNMLDRVRIQGFGEERVQLVERVVKLARIDLIAFHWLSLLNLGCRFLPRQHSDRFLEVFVAFQFGHIYELIPVLQGLLPCIRSDLSICFLNQA